MKIKKITSQIRRDFTATLVCEHCDHEQELTKGYDDEFYHSKVIPDIKCKSCGKSSTSGYRPLTTKYPEGKTV